MKAKILAFVLALIFINLSAAANQNEKPPIRKMIAQMIIVGFNGASVNEARAVISDAKYQRFGGVMLLGRNIKDKQNLIKLTSALQSAQNGLFIAIDEEGGIVTRFKDKAGFEVFNAAGDVAKSLDLAQVKELYGRMATQLKGVGVNLNFAPVVDVLNVNSPIIASKKRAFSKNIDEVSLYASEFLEAFNEVGVLTTMKHFPGHGSAHADSHTAKTVIEKFDYTELKPYYDAIKKNQAKMIMVAHVYINDEDRALPASLSPKIVQNLLRDKLKFDGVVVSDDMLMGGLKGFTLQQKIENFIKAGGDILLFSDFMINDRRTAEYVTQIIVDAINAKRISAERIEQSYARIMKLKAQIR